MQATALVLPDHAAFDTCAARFATSPACRLSLRVACAGSTSAVWTAPGRGRPNEDLQRVIQRTEAHSQCVTEYR